MGHKTYQIILKYAHLSPEQKQRAVDILALKTVKSGLGRSIEYGTNLAQAEKPVITETVTTYAN